MTQNTWIIMGIINTICCTLKEDQPLKTAFEFILLSF